MEKEKILEYMTESTYKPLNAEDLANALGVVELETFLASLRELEEEGKIILARRKNRYGLAEKMGLILGRIQGHSKGFAFFIPDDKELQDVFISPDDLNGALHNDRVLLRLNKGTSGMRKEGEVIRIIKRANQTIVGTFQASKKQFGFVVPDEKKISLDIFVSADDFGGAREGDKVVVRVTSWPEKRRNPEGKVIEVLGKTGKAGVDILSIVRKYQLPEEFPAEVEEAASKIGDTVPAEAYADRRDIRSLKMVTIDGADAKDLDDAVSLEILENGNYSLGVHIADVGYYVKEGGILDKEAFNRGTSVYLVDRVIPMLPRKLSNGICSLNPRVDRLAMTAMMEINHRGEVVAHDIFPSVINIDERMTYDDVRKILVEDDQELCQRYADFVDTFKLMEKLCKTLKGKRLRRGAIDFDFPESKVILDEEGKPVEIVKRIRSIAEMIIEEFMLCANETVAEHMYWLEAPFVYRVHEEPDHDDLLDLNNFLNNFGFHIRLTDNEIKPVAYQKIINNVQGKPEEKLINTVMLRSMKHARYAEESLGHFGLAAKYYAHFTSPIRRYPDLVIHRVIREYLINGWSLSSMRKNKLKQMMHDNAVQSSIREKAAEEAERESVDLKKVEYMERHLGDIFEGVISSVTSFGFFVELDNSVEGLVRISTIGDDYYRFMDKQLALMGDHTKKMYKIGDRVKVQVAKINTAERQIDFEIVFDEEENNY